MHVGVIGAGLTGLAAVHELVQRGIQVTCFEASDEPGGVVRSTAIDGTIIEYGPQRMRRSPIVDEYLRITDLDDELLTAPADLPIYVYTADKLRVVPFDFRAGLRTDLLSIRGKLRLLLEPRKPPAQPGESAADYFERKLGTEAYRNVIEPLFGGLYASDPAAMPVDYALAPLVELEKKKRSLLRIAIGRLLSRRERPAAIVPELGMQELPRRLADRYAEQIHFGTTVDNIEQVEGDGYAIMANGMSTFVDKVIVATPATQAAHLLRSIDDGTATALQALNYNPLALVYLRAPIDRRGLGYQVQRTEPLQTLGVSWNGVAFGRDDLHTAFLGGMHDPDLVDRPDEDLFEIAIGEFETVMGVRPSPLHVHRVEPGMPAYDRSWHHRERLSPPNGIHLAGNYTSRVGIPGRLQQGRTLAARIAEAPTY